MFRLFNDTDADVVITRKHRMNDEAHSDVTVPSGSPFEGSETSYEYLVAEEHKDLILSDRKEPMINRVLRYADKQRAAMLEQQRLAEEASLAEESRLPSDEPQVLTLDDVGRLAELAREAGGVGLRAPDETAGEEHPAAGPSESNG